MLLSRNEIVVDFRHQIGGAPAPLFDGSDIF
jgi:hypothetical protein